MPDPNDPLIGTLVAGRYRVVRPLGEGGMGQVYLAEHEAIQKKIALKVLRAEYAMKGDIVTRFQQEAISASRIKHPNVLDVFDFGRLESGAFYLAMEFLEGHDLAEELTRSHVLTPERGLRLAQQMVKALGAAHAKGVVHRDMKPENVFLQETGDGDELVKIVDFGIAQLRTNADAAASEPKPRRLTRTGMIFGTPEYMSPEQAGGKHADQRADVYAVGIILYEMFTGAVPFTGETFLGVLAKHLNDAPPAMGAVYPDLEISAELEGVIQRALAKNPAERFQTMGEFSQALAATPEGHGTFSSRTKLPSRTVVQEPGAPTAPQFRVQGPQSAAPTLAANVLAGVPSAAVRPSLELVDSTREGAVTRAITEGATSSTVSPGKSRSGVMLGALVGVALAAAAGGALVLRGGETKATNEPITPVATPPAPTTPVTVSAAPAPPVVVPAPSPSVAPAAVVRLSVVTEPAGATLQKDGFQVCDETPCEVSAAPNETLELTAVKGAQKGSAKVLAQRDQRVSIRLTGGAVTPKPNATAAATAMKPQCEVMVGDLKILRDCP